MFSTLKQRLLLGVYIFIMLSIPTGAYLASQAQNLQSKADENNQPLPASTPRTIGTAKNELLGLTEQKAATDSSIPTPVPESSSPTIATSFGPTLSLKAILEGRPETDQSTKMFVGIIEGAISNSPKYLLSFSINVGASGSYEGLSLAGLTSGSSYTALLKGQAQLAKAVSFTMGPNVTTLDSVTLTTGDLNEDNTIDSTDLSIVKSAMGSTPQSSNWNKSADFNLDNAINIVDYAILYRNFSKTGDSGVWKSTPVSTSSASLSEPTGGRPGGSKPAIGGPQSDGHWIWVPNL